jgi:hypothetical protein
MGYTFGFHRGHLRARADEIAQRGAAAGTFECPGPWRQARCSRT